MNTSIKIIVFIVSFFINDSIYSNEMIIGKETIKPGIDIVFEGAIKDEIEPGKFFLDQRSTDVHLEALINWSEKSPIGSPIGGFIPYLKVEALVINIRNDIKEKFLLTPHLNMSDNFHYASNIKLPGKIDDNYDIEFFIYPPKEGIIGYHYDWVNEANYPLILPVSYKYKSLNFKKIVNSKRR